MAIKKLQRDYTTEEQSKRLLELGVPADSADCYYSYYIKKYAHSEYTEILWHRPRFITEDNVPIWNARLMDGTQTYLPCWSAGRLIEICQICTGIEIFNIPSNNTLIDTILNGLDWSKLDFSKLEE